MIVKINSQPIVSQGGDDGKTSNFGGRMQGQNPKFGNSHREQGRRVQAKRVGKKEEGRREGKRRGQRATVSCVKKRGCDGEGVKNDVAQGRGNKKNLGHDNVVCGCKKRLVKHARAKHKKYYKCKGYDKNN